METKTSNKSIDNLRESLASGRFHHATYRCIGTVWEGLWWYEKDADGFRGYSVAGCVNKADPAINEAHELVCGTGVSVGAYGQG
jgi:hypothetical protein